MSYAEAFVNTEVYARFPDELVNIEDVEAYNEYDEDDNPVDVYAYWIVSERAWYTLKELNEPVYIIHNLYVWGRCCTGQAMYMDYAVIEAAEKMLNYMRVQNKHNAQKLL